MAEAHLRADGEHPRVDRRSRRARLDPEERGGAPQAQRVADRVGGGELEQPLCLLRERRQPPNLERVLDPVGDARAEAARELGGGHPARQLQQRQRVAARLGDQPLGHTRVQPARDDRLQQRAGVVVAEPVQPLLGQAGQRVARPAHGEHDRHRLGEQPPRDEPEHLPGRPVEPLVIVDQAQQRPRLGDVGQQRERGQADQEAVGRRPGGEPQRDPQRVALRGRECVEAIQQRHAELMQPGERQLHLGLHAGHLDHAEVVCLLDGVARQRGLADACVAPQHEDAAPAPARVLEQTLEYRPLVRSALQRGRHEHPGTYRVPKTRDIPGRDGHPGREKVLSTSATDRRTP